MGGRELMILIIKMIALKSPQPRCELFPTRTLKRQGRYRVHITCNTSSAYHVQDIVCHVVRRDSRPSVGWLVGWLVACLLG